MFDKSLSASILEKKEKIVCQQKPVVTFGSFQIS